MSESILGVDLGSHAVKLLQLKLSKGAVTVLACSRREVAAALAQAKSPEEQEGIYADALKGCFASGRFTTRSACVVLSGNSALTRFLKLPRDYKADAKSGLPEGAAAALPFDAKEAELAFRVLEGDLRTPKELMLVAAPRQAVRRALSIVRKAGLRPEAMLTDALALESARNALAPEDAETCVVADIGAATTTLVVIAGGTVKAVRVFNIAGDHFTRALKREFAVSTEEAEELKHEYGLLGQDPRARVVPDGADAETAARIYNETAQRALRALKPAVRALCLEIRRMVAAVVERRPALVPIGKVVLAGGSAAMKFLPEAVEAETGMQVEVSRPLRQAPARRGVAPDALDSPALTVAAGLALSRARPAQAAPSLNLLPRKDQRAASRRRGFLRVVVPALLLLGLAAAARTGYLLARQRLSAWERERELQLKAATVKPARAPRHAAPAAQPPKPKPVASPYDYLRRLEVSMVFGGGETVMLTDGKRVFQAKDGLLYDEEDKRMAGVSSAVVKRSLVLTAADGSKTVIPLYP